MRRRAVAVLLALLCVSVVGCKNSSGSTDDAGADASFDSGAGGATGVGGTAGVGGAAGVGGSTGMAGAAGVGGSSCEFAICPTGCVDLDTDDQNCGNCGIICAGSEVCVDGGCVPDPR